MFWRTFVALFLHMLGLLTLQSMSLKLGFFDNVRTYTQIEDIMDRPPDETVTAFSFIRQPFFHKAFAINAHHKKKHILRNRKFCLFF